MEKEYKISNGIISLCFQRAFLGAHRFEVYPKDSGYLDICPKPMDFATIDRKLPFYESITDLQTDLVLMFQNHMRYHGSSSEYGKLAK